MSRKSGDRFPACAKPWLRSVTLEDASAGGGRSEKDMRNASKDTRRIVPTLTPTMLVAWAVLATLPFWIERVGLYQYIGVEILIWATYALAYNLVLGHAGLPSFGHGAFFGIGAYAFGLAQRSEERR